MARFPLDLLQTQHEWNRTAAALGRRRGLPVEAAAPLRRRLQQLHLRIEAHPFWETSTGRSAAAKDELRQRVREMEAAEENLTDQQRRILTCIRDWVAERGEVPTMREIADHVGLASTGSVSYQLDKMERAGVIRRSKGRIALRW
ncbi:winged helix-turn-helix transcriptional regulator [Streptomyces sp. NPDC006655]|uniref:LexA family protein n=1 Tax=Streptomyces sp. NPDC006655 TaxID=3156898 RepID=UPI003455A1F7